MSSNLIHSLTDENPDLKKHIGCMNGIFQLLDRHSFLAKRFHGHSHNKLPPVGECGNQAVESSSSFQKATQKGANDVVKEKITSTESSRTSFSSSSRSSSFSSADYARTVPVELYLSSQTISSGTSIHDLPANRPSSTIQSSQQGLDFRDVIRNSMHREVRGIAVRTTTKDEAVIHTLKYIDSPRPLQPPKFVKPKLPGLNESFQVFSKLREAPRSGNEQRDGCMHCSPKQIRRLSYDERDTLKSNINIKELPRLSLDSKAGSFKGSNSETKSRNYDQMIDMQPEPESSKRSSSVIAKLMGIEAFPDSRSTSEGQSKFNNICQTNRHDLQSESTTVANKNKQDSFPGSQKNARKNSASNKMKNDDLINKATSIEKCPIETAPWKQIQGSRGSQPSGSKCDEVPAQATNSSPSIYGEIEKRLAEIEFKKSGKDLRALKQILETMKNTKGMLDSKKDPTSSFESRMSYSNGLGCGSNLESHKSLQSNISKPPPRTYRSPIIIMKPAKFNEKNTDPASAVSSFDNLTSPRKLQSSDSTFNKKELVEKRRAKHPSQKNVQSTNHANHCQSSTEKNVHRRTSISVQTSKPPRNNSEGNSCGSTKSSGTASFSLQHRKLGLDKQSHHVNSSSDSSRSRRHRSRQPTESSSPTRKCMSGSLNLQRSQDQLSDAKTSIRHLSQHGNALSIRSESTISLDSHPDKETTLVIQPQEIKCTDFKHDGKNQRDAGLGGAVPENASAEQPSPVSVLDATFYRDDLPSPVKKISISFEDEEILYPDEIMLRSVELAQLSDRESCFSTEIDSKTLEDIKNLVQNPRLASFPELEQLVRHPVRHYDGKNSDHIYISDILSASTLLGYLDSGLTNIHFQNLDFAINPKLFFTLERVKANTKLLHEEVGNEKTLQIKYNQAIHRRLVFDVVNEILSHKLVAQSSFRQSLVQKPRGQHLLGKLCSEVDRLQDHDYGSLVEEDDNMRSIKPEDLMDWSGCDSEIPQMVLDIERLIFKDLITEVVKGMAAVSQGQSGQHCRELFSK